ncbi:hypothetical protein ACTFIZ_012495 [Dictyostelium cf. discoideum]
MNYQIYEDVQKFINNDNDLKMNGNQYEASKATGVLCSTIDTNKFGQLSYKEIDIAALADVQALLLRLDKDKDKKLNKTEFIEYFKEQGAYTPFSDCDYIIKTIDLDKDECVSLTELKEWFKKRRMAMPKGPTA